MKLVGYIGIWWMCAACSTVEPVFWYIDSHTSATMAAESVTIQAEKAADLDETRIRDLCWVYNYMSRNSVLMDVVVYIPQDLTSFELVRRYTTSEGPVVAFTLTIDDQIVIIFNPDHWRTDSRREIVDTDAHELAHHVIESVDGTFDSNHLNPKYWGRGGLVDRVVDAWEQNYQKSRRVCHSLASS